jgi:hypothetical protein
MKPSAEQDQSAVIEFLMRPESYGVPGPVERIDTHGAMIFLAGDRAYKLKRAVKLPYLNFSTPALRAEICRRELAINRRTAPQLYLRVAPIREDPGGPGLSFGGEGKAVDWLVVMRRFPKDALLDSLSLDGRLELGLMTELAQTIRRFHDEAEKAPQARWRGTIAQITRTLEETLTGPETEPLGLAAAPYLASLRTLFEAQRPLLRARQRAGYVRRCHGDLHLKNIVLLDGAPVLFDALEFDEDLATIDVLYDLAFLLMDLWRRGRKAEANAVLNGYFEREPLKAGLSGLALLPLFLSLRAAIRAMVGVHGLAVAGEPARAGAEQEVRDYAGLAAALLDSERPRLVAVGGLSGSGKTTIGRGIAPWIGSAPGALHLRSDVERKLMLGVDLLARLPADAYSAEVNARTYARLFAKAEEALQAGHSAVVDAAFLEPGTRDALRGLAAAAGAAFAGLWLEAAPEQLVARVSTRRGDASDADAEVVRGQLRTSATPPAGWQVIDTGDGAEASAASALRSLQGR